MLNVLHTCVLNTVQLTDTQTDVLMKQQLCWSKKKKKRICGVQIYHEPYEMNGEVKNYSNQIKQVREIIQ